MMIGSALAFLASFFLISGEPKSDLLDAIENQAPKLMKLRKQKSRVEFLHDSPLSPAAQKFRDEFSQLFPNSEKPQWIIQVDVIEIGESDPLSFQIGVIQEKSKNKKAEFGITLPAQAK